uniref:Translation initiation factor 2 n=1 Tax=Streptomyces sp. NBC_00003 TaxID=2903608 RepID=A0AAU2VH09_9ACTN
MHASQPLRVPVGPDAHRWRTFRAEKTLVVAARTVTSTVRVLECLPALVRDDSRVSVVFAYDPTSAFSDGVLDLLHDAGCRVMPWEQLGRITPDLIVTASENIDVPDGDCPVLVLPHGVGFQKLVPDSRSARERLSGLVPDALLEAGRAWLAVSHPEQEEQLFAAHPKTAGRTLPVGDPCFDELLAGMRQRDAYRRQLGIADGRRLIAISSTWGHTSLIGQHPELPARLLAALPYDEYRVALIAHPNVWAAHGSWQIRTLQAAALDAGLLLVPPVHAWRPALVAADLVIGDHGSVTLYGACLDIPVLLAAFGTDAVPGTAAFDLARLAPRLDPRADLAGQVEEAVRVHAPQRYSPVTRRAFADPGQAHARLRSALYGLMKLPEPATAAPHAPALGGTNIDAVPCRSWRVSTTVSADESGPVITVRRHPAVVCGAIEERDDTFAHLACAEDEPDRRLAESASVVVRERAAATAVGALRWIADTLERFPGCLLTAVATESRGVLFGLRDGRVIEATSTGPTPDPGLAAAAVYACLRAGQPLANALVTLRIGPTRTEDLALRVRATRQPG